MTTTILSSDESIKQYELLIHSLTHEHTKQYIDRHLLLYEKWCRDYSDGFYIRDISYIIQLFDILRNRCQTHRSMFLPIIFDILKKWFVYEFIENFTYTIDDTE